MSTMTLSTTNSSKTTAESWLTSSVQAFFTGINWQDRSPAVQEIRLTLQEAAELPNLTMSVNQFFAAINWENAAIAASPSVPASSTVAPDELTLDDFSSMF